MWPSGGAYANGEETLAASSLLTDTEVHTPDYAQQLLQRLEEFRQDKLFCDFTLKVEGKTFEVHKAVLAGCSDYFCAMFSHDMVESRQDTVELQSISACGIEPILSYAYTGRMMLSLDSVPDILSAATFLQVKPVIELCTQYMKDNMVLENAEALVALGNQFGLTSLARCYRNMILENFFEFGEKESFLNLDAKTLASYLVDDSLRTPTEGQLLKLVLKWYEHDKVNREHDIYLVLERIRYTLDGWPLIEYASSIEPFISNKKCRELIEWSCRFLQLASRKHLCKSHRTRIRYDRKTLVQIGGLYGNDIVSFQDGNARYGCGINHFFHHERNAWFPLGVNSLTESRSHCPLLEVNGYAILIGGLVYTYDSVRTFRHFSNEVKLFTAAGFALWDLQYMQEERAHHVAVYMEHEKKSVGYIYVVGGINERGPLSSVEKFHMDKERWDFVANLEHPLYSHAGASYKHKVYITGGIEKGQVLNKLQIYDPAEDVWSEGPQMLSARSGHTMALLGEDFLVCGGRPTLDTARCLASVESFNIEVFQWTYLTPMRQDCCNMTSVVFEEKLLIVGGESSVGDLLNQIQEYDPGTGKWGCFSYLPFPLSNTSCCALTIKLSKDGEEETDSLVEAYNLSVFPENGLSTYRLDCSDDSEDEYGAEDWKGFANRDHWPL